MLKIRMSIIDTLDSTDISSEVSEDFYTVEERVVEVVNKALAGYGLDSRVQLVERKDEDSS